jgi:hypothetical protein
MIRVIKKIYLVAAAPSVVVVLDGASSTVPGDGAGTRPTASVAAWYGRLADATTVWRAVR